MLQHLAIEVSLALDMSRLVKNMDYVVYPCLTKLRLATAPPPSHRPEYDPQQASPSVKHGTLRSTLPSVTPGVVLFPSLKSLTIINSYPFADDAPFKGNAKQLQYLRLLLTRNICGILHRRSVFTPTSHPQLQYVEVEFPSTDVYDYFETNDKYLKLALTLGPNSAVRAIRSIQSANKRVPVLTLLQGHESIQMLILYDTRLVLQDVFRLVKWLPLLSDLHCLSLYYGSQPYPTGGKYAKHMYTVRNMERPRFRCLRIGFDMDFNVEELVDKLVECVLYIALRFPSFDYAAVTDDILPKFMETMEQSIALDAYQPTDVFDSDTDSSTDSDLDIETTPQLLQMVRVVEYELDNAMDGVVENRLPQQQRGLDSATDDEAANERDIEVGSESIQQQHQAVSVAEDETSGEMHAGTDIVAESESRIEMASPTTPTSIEANIRAFVAKLKQMLPMVKSVKVKPDSGPNDVLEGVGFHFSSLITQLYQLSNEFDYAPPKPSLPMELRTDDIHELVKFTYHDDVNDTSSSAWVTLVTRRSAATLQSLHFIVHRRVAILDVIQDSDRGYISYPCLT
ncbi:hypothetical protein H4S07_002148, partial [Coemansia furcata]